MSRHIGWLGIVRLGLVQTALGAIIVLTTSTLNRVMVVELALPAMIPGALVGIHHVVQLLRPRLGYGSDVGGRRTPWIIGGMAVLALGGFGAAVATAVMESNVTLGVILGAIAFTAIGLGAGAAGTSLLVLLAKRVEPKRRGAAATTAWVMMIVGFIITAGIGGKLLDPFSLERLMLVSGVVSLLAFTLALAAVWGVEGEHAAAIEEEQRPSFRTALAQVWDEPVARGFTLFVFISMLSYSLQDLILEPFAGAIFGLTPGQSTMLSGLQHGGVLCGMLLVGFLSGRFGTLRQWTIGGCLASALALLALASGGIVGAEWPLRANVFLLGAANGAFAVSAIGSMMNLAGAGRASREGVRMGLWGAAQAIAFAIGGFMGTVAADAARALLDSQIHAYAVVFAGEALLFIYSARLAARFIVAAEAGEADKTPTTGELLAQAANQG
ncbi:BCD family MFS transporter [Rhodocyclus tenuis]|uniref:BCD family chlorophyll transporter-like MFS transporter n=1 Tax=Rhodocyclus tenuis TaxID=1066 RepID=A0A840GB81_RHOTE|nr:BCD family MFS transporter [Rhodocyclus tenuis]MBB4249125.1 BCD family chlorophyll transporter-like MFS transporter [Rhodocyclus tenuis]